MNSTLILAVTGAIGIWAVLRERKLGNVRALKHEHDGWLQGKKEMGEHVLKVRHERARSSVNEVTIAAEMVGGPVDGMRGAVAKSRDWMWAAMPCGEVHLYSFQSRSTKDGFWVYEHQANLTVKQGSGCTNAGSE